MQRSITLTTDVVLLGDGLGGSGSDSEPGGPR